MSYSIQYFGYQLTQTDRESRNLIYAAEFFPSNCYVEVTKTCLLQMKIFILLLLIFFFSFCLYFCTLK